MQCGRDAELRDGSRARVAGCRHVGIRIAGMLGKEVQSTGVPWYRDIPDTPTLQAPSLPSHF